MAQLPTRIRDPRAGEPLPRPHRERLAALIERYGEAPAIKLLCVPRPTVTRALAGLGLRHASAVYLTQQIHAVEALGADRAA